MCSVSPFQARAECQIATPGFPNMFVILGSNTSPGISAHLCQLEARDADAADSVTTHLEVQAEYITECIVQMRRKDVKVFEVKQEATDRYNT